MSYSAKTKLDEEAYKRDGFKCVECDKTTGIEAHHIIPDLEELDNLVTLCHACHKKRHNMAGCFGHGDPKDKHQFKKGNTFGEKGHRFTSQRHYNRWKNKWGDNKQLTG